MLRRLTPLLLTLLGPVAWAGEKKPLAELLPPETPVIFVGRGLTPEEMKTQAAWRCFEEPAFKKVLERLMSDENATVIPLGEEASLLVRQDVREQPVAVQLRYVDGKGERKFRIQDSFGVALVGFQDGPLPVDVVVALAVDSDPQEALSTVQRIVAAVALMVREEEGESIDDEMERIFSDAEHRETRYVRGKIEGVPFFAAAIGGQLVFTSSEARLRDMVDRDLDGGRPSLADDPRHREVLKHAIGTGTVNLRIDVHVDRALDAMQTRFPGPAFMARNYLKQMGLEGLRTFTTVTRVEGSGVSTTTSVLLDGERRGLARLFEGGGPAKLGGLAFAPKDTLYVTCGSFDVAALYQTALEVGGMFLAMAGAKFEEKFGVKLREDVLDLVGPEAAFIVAPTRGLLPDVGLVLESRDAPRLEQSLLRLLRQLPWPEGTGLETVKIGESSLHVVPLGHRELGGVPLAPCFGVVDGSLLIAPYPLTFQRFLAVKRGERPSLAQNRDFANLRSRVPGNAVAISYLDLPRVIAIFYDTVMPLLQAMPENMPGQRAPLYELPDMSILERHLYGRIGWTVADERGRHWYSHGSMDMTGITLGAIGVGTGLATWFVVGKAQPEPPVGVPVPVPAGTDTMAAQCESNVRYLRNRLRQYHRKHDAFPDSLDDLRFVPAEKRGVPGTEQAYAYLGSGGKGAVLLHGFPNGADGKISILTRRLVMRRVTEAELQQLLGGSAPEER